MYSGDIMLTDLNKLKGFDFSKKIIYTDNLNFDDLFFMSEKGTALLYSRLSG